MGADDLAFDLATEDFEGVLGRGDLVGVRAEMCEVVEPSGLGFVDCFNSSTE